MEVHFPPDEARGSLTGMKGLCLTPTGQARVHLDNTFSIKVAEWRAVPKTTWPPGLDHSLCQGEWASQEGVHGPGWHLQVTGEAKGVPGQVERG